MADAVAGEPTASVGPPHGRLQVKRGDGQADFLGDLNVGGLFGSSVLVDVPGDWGDPGRGPYPFEDQQPGR
jgi:hypothetical protein